VLNQAAEVDEVFLTGGAFFQFVVPPFIDEGLRGIEFVGSERKGLSVFVLHWPKSPI
jgi:hypothetical protein